MQIRVSFLTIMHTVTSTMVFSIMEAFSTMKIETKEMMDVCPLLMILGVWLPTDHVALIHWPYYTRPVFC